MTADQIYFSNLGWINGVRLQTECQILAAYSTLATGLYRHFHNMNLIVVVKLLLLLLVAAWILKIPVQHKPVWTGQIWQTSLHRMPAGLLFCWAYASHYDSFLHYWRVKHETAHQWTGLNRSYTDSQLSNIIQLTVSELHSPIAINWECSKCAESTVSHIKTFLDIS